MNIIFKVSILILILSLAYPVVASSSPTPPSVLLRSALIPGWGELVQGDRSGYALLAMEILLWGTRFYFLEEEKLQSKTAYNFAIRYAHIDPSGNYDDDFLYHMSRYNSYGFDAGGYNANILIQAESIIDPQARLEFIQNNIYDDDHYWYWDDRDKRNEYGILRKDAAHFTDYAKTVGGVIIANHILSAINALRIRARQKRINLTIGFDNNLNPAIMYTHDF